MTRLSTTALSNSRATLAMLGICCVVVLVSVDQTVVGTALPRMVAELQGFSLYGWVASAYLLASAILIPITGRLGDLFGRKPFVLAAIVVFTLASGLCGLASSMLELVLLRGLQGVGGGLVIGSAFASVADIFPDQVKRIRWQVMISAAFGIFSAVGPALGGYLTEHFGWRSVFYVNLPIGVVALGVVAVFLPRIRPRHTKAALDWPGTLLLALTIASTLLAAEGTGGRNMVLTFATVALIGLGSFLYWERRAEQPILPLRLFRQPAVRLLSILAVLTGGTLFSLVYYAPLLLQGGFGLSPATAGRLITPLVVCITVGSAINGRLIPRVAQPHRLMLYGLSLLMLGICSLFWVSATTPEHWVLLAFGLCGLGLGFQMPNLTIHIQAAVASRHIGVASAMVQTMRMLGSMVGATMVGVWVQHGFADYMQTTLAQQVVPPATAQLFDSPQILMRPAQQAAIVLPPGLRDHLLDGARAALIHGVHNAFAVALGMAMVATLVAWRLPPLILRRSEQGVTSGE